MLLRIFIFLLPLLCFAELKLGYQDVITRAMKHGRKALVLTEQNKVANYSYIASRKGLQPIFSAESNYQTAQDSTGHLNISQKFAAGTSATLAFDLFHNKDTSLTLTQPLLNGYGINGLNLLSAKNTYQQANITWLVSVQGIIQDVLNAYWNVISAEKNIEVQLLAKESAKRLYEQYKIKYNMGSLPRSNLVEQNAQLARIQLEELQQNTAKRQAKQLLKVMINVPNDQLIKLTGKLDINVFGKMPSLKSVLKQVSKNNPNIALAKLALDAADYNYKIALNSAKAQLNLTATMQKDIGASVGLSVNVPINDPTLKQQVVSAKSALFQAKINLQQTSQDNLQLASNTWQELASKVKENQLLKNNLATSKKLYELSITQYKYGKASSLDVVTRQKTLVSDQQALISNTISYLQDFIKLCGLEGALLRLFGIDKRISYV